MHSGSQLPAVRRHCCLRLQGREFNSDEEKRYWFPLALLHL